MEYEDCYVEELDGREAYAAAARAAAHDEPWTAQREPWCRACPEVGPRSHEHAKLVDVFRCRADDWGLKPGSWRTSTRLWWMLRDHCPEALQATSVDGLGRRLVREGWRPRWKGKQKVYFITDLLEQPPSRTAKRRY